MDPRARPTQIDHHHEPSSSSSDGCCGGGGANPSLPLYPVVRMAVRVVMVVVTGRARGDGQRGVGRRG